MQSVSLLAGAVHQNNDWFADTTVFDDNVRHLSRWVFAGVAVSIQVAETPCFLTSSLKASNELAETIAVFSAAFASFDSDQLPRLNIELLVFNNFPLMMIIFAHDVATIRLFLFEG